MGGACCARNRFTCNANVAISLCTRSGGVVTPLKNATTATLASSLPSSPSASAALRTAATTAEDWALMPWADLQSAQLWCLGKVQSKQYLELTKACLNCSLADMRYGTRASSQDSAN